MRLRLMWNTMYVKRLRVGQLKIDDQNLINDRLIFAPNLLGRKGKMAICWQTVREKEFTTGTGARKVGYDPNSSWRAYSLHYLPSAGRLKDSTGGEKRGVMNHPQHTGERFINGRLIFALPISDFSSAEIRCAQTVSQTRLAVFLPRRP